MMRTLGLVIAFALVGAACGGSPTSTPAVDPEPTAVSATTTVAPGDASTTTPAGSSETSRPPGSATTAPATRRPEGPDAPDIALALGEGGVFVLSEEQKPVYMVFWAEW